MAPTRRIDEIGSGIPFEEIYSTVLSKLFILSGMAEINIAEIDTLEKKSKYFFFSLLILGNNPQYELIHKLLSYRIFY